MLCLDCGIFLCNYCHGHHKYSKDYQNHNMMPLNELRSKKEEVAIKPKTKYAMCQKHELELNFYCETCDQLVCHYCIVKEHLKDDHAHDTVKEMAAKHRKELDKIMEPVEKMIERLSVACKKVSNERNSIGAQADDIHKEIDMYYEELHRRLQQQRDELKKELHEASRQKKKEVTLQLEQMEHTQAQLESIKELNGAMKNGSDQEALLMKKQLVDDVKRISDSYNKLDTQPVQSATMEFVPAEEYRKSMPQFGHLCRGYVCPVNCEVDLPEEVLEGKVEFKIVTKDKSNYLYHKGGSEVVAQTQSSSGDITPVKVKDNKDGSYSASFVANQVGEVKLSVTIKGQQIKGSPFSVKIHGKYTTLDKPNKVVNEGGRMGRPWGIAFGRDGMWAVTDDTNHCVWIFDRDDQLVRKFGSKGTDSGKFDRPLGVAFDSTNHLYVTDYGNRRVQKFDIASTCLPFGNHQSGNGQLQYPIGIAIHDDKVYVSNPNRILIFNCDGQFSGITIGLGHLESVYYITVSANNQIFVADYGQNCIVAFSFDGNCLGKYGTQGTGRGQLKGPCGVAVDKFGLIFAAEHGNCRVSIFDKDGVFIHSFGTNSQFSALHAMVQSPSGSLYICDTGNKRIQIFQPDFNLAL